MSIDDAWSVRAEGEEIRPEEKRENMDQIGPAPIASVRS